MRIKLTHLAAGLVAALLTSHVRAAEPPIRIGVLTDMSGPYSAGSGPGSVAAAQMAAEDFAKPFPFCTMSAIMGGHVQVGLEDKLFIAPREL